MATKSIAPIVPDPELQRLLARSRDHALAARAVATKRAYANDWQRFDAWCTSHGLASRPACAEAVAAWVVHLAETDHKPSTIERMLVAVSVAHKVSGLVSPTSSAIVRETLRGLRRHLGTAPKQVAPLVADQLRLVLRQLGTDVAGLRDRALLLVGFVGAFRRSELVAIVCEDLEARKDGIVVTLRKSKTDQERAGRQIALPVAQDESLCPVRALRAWLDAAQIRSGIVFRPVLRSGYVLDRRLEPSSVARVIKRCVESAGLDPSLYSGHSLRAGFATTAALAGRSELSIMAQTGHRSVQMVRRYIRDGGILRDNAARGLL